MDLGVLRESGATVHVAPFVVSGVICLGVWLGGVFRWRVSGWVICVIGHLLFVAYGAWTGRHGFLIVPPFTALGLVITIRRYLGDTRRIGSKLDTLERKLLEMSSGGEYIHSTPGIIISRTKEQ